MSTDAVPPLTEREIARNVKLAEAAGAFDPPDGPLQDARLALLDAHRNVEDLLRLARSSARTRKRIPGRDWDAPFARAFAALERLEKAA